MPIASLRQQMDRQCKQRRFLDASNEPFPDPVEADARLTALGAHGPGVEVKREPRAEDGAYWARHGHSVAGPEHCIPGRSVFDVDAYPESGEPPPLLVLHTPCHCLSVYFDRPCENLAPVPVSTTPAFLGNDPCISSVLSSQKTC